MKKVRRCSCSCFVTDGDKEVGFYHVRENHFLDFYLEMFMQGYKVNVFMKDFMADYDELEFWKRLDLSK